MADLDKEKVAKVLADSAQALRSVTAERDKLAEQNYRMSRHFEAQKLAAVMHEKGINMDVDTEALVDKLEKAAEAGRLPAIQEAMDMMAPNMGFTGTLTNDDVHGSGETAFESFIIGGVG
jgi:TPR repeat protein